MESTDLDQSSAPAKTEKSSSKLRYPLRSATKSKDEKTANSELSSSSTKRARPVPTMSKSVNVLDLSGKDKTGKPPRRLSVPSKQTVNSASKSSGTITPISEARAKRSGITPGKNDTPVSNVSRSSARGKFSVLSSASYWLSQVKLSEAVAKHSISLGFFRLALEAGCEPIQKMRDELKSYARRHKLAELGEPARELFESYNILESFEQLQVSETCSYAPEEGTKSSDDDVHSSSSVTGGRKLKPKSLNVDASPNTVSSTKDSTQKPNPGSRTRGQVTKSANTKTASDASGQKASKKYQKTIKQEPKKNKESIKKPEKKPAQDQGAADNPLPTDEPLQENKENMEAHELEKMSVTAAA